jgi:hypothetical protein
LCNPLQRGSRGCGMFIHQNHAAGGENGSIMVGMFVCLCLASQKSSERDFFLPTRTNLGVKLFISDVTFEVRGRLVFNKVVAAS